MAEVIEFLVNQVFLSVVAIFMLAGAIFVLIGAFVLRASFFTTEETYETKGEILGALQRSTTKKRKDGSLKTHYNNNLVLAYKDPSGEQKRGSASEWSSSFIKFRTGQILAIRVTPSQAYDDIYLADRSGNVKLGIVMIVVGFAVFMGASRSVLWAGVLAVIAVLFVMGLQVFLQGVDTSKQKTPPAKRFADDEIVPLESINSP